jgi:photosystem II stability/assembly factor-like uncharacterized protein
MFLPLNSRCSRQKGCFQNIFTYAFLLCLLVCFAGPAHSQFKQVHLESDENSHLERIDFYSGAEGYIAFTKTLGFTADSGKTVSYKPITNANVNFNGYSVNLTFGFELSGVKAFDHNKLLLYGNYGLVPAILYSADGGNTFKVVFHSQFSQVPNSYIADMSFAADNRTGFALDRDRILKTTDGGLTWSVSFTSESINFNKIQVVSNNNVQVYNTNQHDFNSRYSSKDGGATWETIYSFTGISCQYFFNNDVVWQNTRDGKLLISTDGGKSLMQQNDVALAPVSLDKMVVMNDSTAYGIATEGFEVYKTTNRGKIWERLHRDNNFSYLNYTLNDIQVKGNVIWVGGSHGYLALSSNNGGTVIPRAYFTVDETAAETTGIIKLNNYSKSGNTYKWLLNGKVIATTYNASYTAELYGPNDTLQLVVANKQYADTLTKVTTFSQAIKITRVYPVSAATGQLVTISGEHFQDITNVTFGGVPAASFKLYSGYIDAVVGKGASGEVKVTTTKASSSFAGFTYIPPPKILSFLPASAAKGDTVVIKGEGFGSLSMVKFNNIEVDFRFVSETEVRVVVPDGNTTGDIIINGYTGADTAGTFKLQPFIKSLDDNSGRYNSTIVVRGTGFYDVESITLDGQPVISFDISNSSYNGDYATIKLGEGGAAGKLVITLNNGLSATYTGFKYYFTPAITSFAPASGNAGGQVTITGNNFSTVSTENFVYFGTVKASVSSATATSLVVMVPAGATHAPITVATKHATSTSSKYFMPTFNGGVALAESSFGALTSVWPSNNPIYLSIGDFTGDGKPDISVTAWGEAGNMSHFVENKSIPGNISISVGQSVRLSSGADSEMDGAISSVVTDWDLDGDLDVVLAGLYRSNPTYVRSTYAPGSNYSFPNEATNVSSYKANFVYDRRFVPTGMGAADMDGDGQTDFLVSGNFPDNPTFPNITLSDMDGDGKPDVLVHLSDTLAVYRNISVKNSITYAPRVNFLAGGTIGRIVTGDFDNDGKTDIVMTVKNAPGVIVWKNNSTPGNIALDKATTMNTTAEPSSIAIADLNGDGKVDIGVGHDGKVLLYQNTSGVSISFAAPVSISLNALTDLAFADLDGDSKPDIIGLVGEGAPALNIMRNIGGGPKIVSFSPEEGPAGTIIEIKGTGFTGATIVTIGGTPAHSFQVNSETSITAVAGDGAKGFIALGGPAGQATSLSVFHFLPEPVIYVNGYLTQASAINLGDSVRLAITPYDDQFKVQWYKDGIAIAGETNQSLVVKSSGSYTGSMVYGNAAPQTSKPVQVRVVFALPANNIRVASTSVTCKGSKNGSISIHANQAASYTATLSGGTNKTLTLSSDAKFDDLAPGNYTVCITISSYPEYQQCFDLVITEPKDLSVYTIANKPSNTVELMLDGADFYHISINGKLYTSTGSVTLPLNKGMNKIAISTDKLCQGTVEKVIDLSDKIIPYPNPVRDVLNINLGNTLVANASITITSVNGGRVLYRKEVANSYGVLQVNMAEFQYGVYLVRLKLDNNESVYKITKQ